MAARSGWQRCCSRRCREPYIEYGASPQEGSMGHQDTDRPDDSKQRHPDGSIREETSATGQRVKGAIKDAAGDMTDNEGLEDKGERENQAGKDRQKKNDAV